MKNFLIKDILKLKPTRFIYLLIYIVLSSSFMVIYADQNLNDNDTTESEKIIEDNTVKNYQSDNVVNDIIQLNEYLKDENTEIQVINLKDLDNKLINEDSNKSYKTTSQYDNNNLDYNTNKSKYNKNSASAPSSGQISAGQFFIPTRGFVNINGPKVSLTLSQSNAIETLKVLTEMGGYGFIFINDQNKENSKEMNIPLVDVNFTEETYSKAFNSILMASGLQAKMEDNIIFVGKNVLNKSLNPKISKTYRLNQASSSSVADYLASLGATISKVFVKSTALVGDEVGSGGVNIKDLTENYIASYGNSGGPLKGLIGTVDLRLHSITLIGDEKLISLAENYIKTLDLRHRQVALSIKIIDVALTKADLTNSKFDAQVGDTYIIGGQSFGLSTGTAGKQVYSTADSLVNNMGLSSGQWTSWLERKLTTDTAKIIASPTLLLGENQEALIGGIAQSASDLAGASIGRPYANEAFIKVGTTVVTSFNVTTSEGVTTCNPTFGTSGITFGAKLHKIDDNGFVSFSLSPAISSVTATSTVTGCNGSVSTLSVRQLDTGSVRVRDGNTLILSGVIKDDDVKQVTKTPVLGDIPLLGRMFRSNSTTRRKSELIILVTPRIINEEVNG